MKTVSTYFKMVFVSGIAIARNQSQVIVLIQIIPKNQVALSWYERIQQQIGFLPKWDLSIIASIIRSVAYL